MAVFGPFSTVRAQLAHDPRFKAAFAYVAETLQPDSSAARRIGAIATGITARIDLTGGSFSLEQVYSPKARSEGFFESHRKYIDVQVVVAGEELMEVEAVARLVVMAPYDPERDLLKYADTATAAVLRLRPGDAAVFFPGGRPHAVVALARPGFGPEDGR